MSPEMVELLKGVNTTHEQIGNILSKLNDSPSSLPVTDALRKAAAVTPGGMLEVQDRRMMTAIQMADVRESLKTKSLRELHVLFAKQASRRDTGVPLYEWLAAGGAPLGARWDGRNGLAAQVDPTIQKALTTDSASALIRQDLEPILYEIFVKIFPMADLIQTEPANGLVHAYDKQTSYGDAQWIGELDTVVDDRGTYTRAFTNIGILATRRGVSLKSQFAVLAGGAGFNPERLELQAGMRAMSSRLQKTILAGNWLDPTGTLNNEIGPFDENSIDGFRKALYNSVTNVDVDPATNPDTTGSLRRAIDKAIAPIVDAGGQVSAIYGAPSEQITFDEQQESKERIIINQGSNDLTVGERVTRVRTINGILPFFGVPGGFIGNYVPTNHGSTGFAHARDMYLLDLDTITRPYLGSEGPTVLEIPVGVSGQLTHLFIIFMMTGMAVKVPTWSNKVRVKVD